MAVSAIIFDLGGVLLPIYPERTREAFTSLFGKSSKSSFEQLEENHLFEQYEQGIISTEMFYSYIQQAAGRRIERTEIDNAWNALLDSFDAQRIVFLQKLTTQIPVFLLSNTNYIHLEAVNKSLSEKHGINDLSSLFTKAYYSFRMQMRKPEARIWQHVLQMQGLNPSDTLFFDDMPANVEAAKSVGLQSIQVSGDTSIETLVEKYLHR